MKKIFIVLLVLYPFLARAEPVINFVSETHDFGRVKQGDRLEYIFRFVNKGTDDLIIDKVNTS